MKTNITLKLDADLLWAARILAAEESLSISGLLAAKLVEVVRQCKRYDRFRRRAMRVSAEVLILAGPPSFTR